MARHVQHAPIILASRSPRRKALLQQAGLTFSVVFSSDEESADSRLDPAAYVRFLAEKKAEGVAIRYPESWVIGADTIVVNDGKILEKPVSKDAAETMLRTLSGKTHSVFTGYAICNAASKRSVSDAVQTGVTFKPLTDPEIAWYASTPEPYDKAGAYAIQGLGTFLVKRINGSYTCVVGLPVCEVMDFLIKEKIIEMAADTPWTPPTPQSSIN
ncbi:MAG: septum formation protein Maf [Deltaproteobacteria bacterium]|nr:septum formation protein Maf [Deltaproteobacteria bacterium]MBW2042334.1 septum formation protein Maf [Deltaproteobacteria bacterium]